MKISTNEKKKSKKIIKKTFSVLGYALVYIFITLGTALGILFLSPTGTNDKNEEIYIAPQISHIYNNFTTVKALQIIDLDARIETPADSFTIKLNADLDLDNGIENMEIEGTLLVEIHSETLTINFSYKNSVVYVDVLNGKYKIQTNNIGDSLNQILSVLNIEMPDLGMDLSNLTPDSILPMLSDLTETKGENSITLTINVPVVGAIELTCDLNYSIERLVLPKTTISEGTSIALSTSLAYPEYIEVEEPEDEYIEATYFFNVAGAALEYINQDQIGFNANVKYNDVDITGNFSADMKDLSAKFTTNILDMPFNLIAKENTLFIEYGNINLKFALEDTALVANLLNEQFNLDIPIDTVASILSALKNGNLFDVLPHLNLERKTKSTSLNDIDLSVIQNFVKVDDSYILSLRDIGNITFILADTKLTGIGFDGFGLNAKLNVTPANPIILATNPDAYINLADIIPAVNAFMNTAKLDNFVGNASLTNNNEVVGTLYFILTKQNANPKAHIEANIYGQTINIDYADGIVFLQFKDIKIYTTFDDIDTISNFLQDVVGLTFEKFDTDKLIEQIKTILNPSINPALIKSLKQVDNGLTITLFNDITFTISYTNLISGLNIDFNNISANIDLIASQDTITLPECNIADYTSIVKILDIVTSVKSYIETSQFDITANAQVYEKREQIYNANVALQIDLKNKFQFYGKAELTGKQDMDIEASLYQDYLYLGYNGLLLKMNSNDVSELLVMVLNILGVDPSILPFLQDVANGMDADLGALSELNTGINLDDPLSIVTLFKSISVVDNTLELVLDGSKISSNERAENMIVKLVTDGKKLVSLNIKNLYTGVSNDEHFDLNIFFNNYQGVTSPDTTKNYIDISGANELIKAVINMTEYRDFEISGNLNIDMSIPVLSNMHLVIPVNFKVKIVDGKPEVLIAIEKIPVVHPLVYNLNNDTTWGYSQVNTFNIATMKSSGETRNLYIYYKDNEVYFYRHELNTKGSTYEKKLKAPLETVMSDILYYVQWGTGFNDDIIGAIRKSLENEHTIDLGNIIRSFTANEDGCTIVLNMTEISGDKNMGDMTLKLGLMDHSSVIDGETVTKKVLGFIDFKMVMPFTDSLQLNMKTEDNNPLTVVNLGQTIDFTDFYNFINNYEYENNVEMEAYNGSWTKAAERQFEVTFVTNQDFTLPNITGVQGSTFELPTYTTIETSNETDRDVYNFVGWYTSSNFTPGTEFTTGIIPHNNVTLYAKWQTLESYRTIEFYVNNIKVDSQYALVGTPLKEVNFDKEYYDDIGIQRFTMTFTGWVDEDGYSITYIPADSDKLYAKYQVTNTVTKYTLSFDTGVGAIKTPVEIYNSYSAEKILDGYDTSNVIVNKDGVTTTYQFAGWYLDPEFTIAFDNIMPEHNLTIYAKWNIIDVAYERVFKIIDGTHEVYSARIKPNEQVNLPTNIKIDNETQWFADAEFTIQTTPPKIMPDNDVTVYIRNKYTLTYTYYYKDLISGYTDRYENKSNTVTVRLYQGEQLTLPEQVNYEFDTYTDNHLYQRMYYSFNGYKENNNIYTSSTMSNHDLTLVSNVKEDYKNYYTVTFATNDYRADGMWAGSYSWESPSFTPEMEYVLDGETINLAQDKYQPTRYGKDTWAASKKLYKATSWGTSSWSNGTKGGSGFTSYTVTGNVTLYACWEKQ